MHGEETLDADARCDAAHGECLADTRALAGDHNALEHLDTLARALDDAGMDAHGIARCELRDVGAELFLLQDFNDVHRFSSFDPGVHTRPFVAQRTTHTHTQ